MCRDGNVWINGHIDAPQDNTCRVGTMQVYTKAIGRRARMIKFKWVACVTVVSFPVCTECIRTVKAGWNVNHACYKCGH